jgi:hypothetical protein
VRERRLERLDGAHSWEERRQRLARVEPERRINPRYLRGRSGASEEPEESGAAGAGDGPGAGDESGAGPDRSAAPGAEERG